MQVSCMLGVALLFGQIMRSFGQPAIFGELIGGIILGPTVMGNLFPTLYGSFFQKANPLTPQIDSLIQIGMLLFMFVKGLEIEFGVTRKRVKCIVLTSIMGIAIPFCLGVVAVLVIPLIQGDYIAAFPQLIPIFIGTALSISALPVILRILEDLKVSKTEIGAVTIISAAINDLVGWTIFACITGSLMYTVSINTLCITILKIICFLAILLGIVPKASQVLTTYMNKLFNFRDVYIGMVIITVLLASILGESLGVHPFFSAFILGIALRKIFDNKGRYTREIISKFAMGFFAPLYFVSIGLKVNFVEFFDIKLVMVIIIIAYLGKISGAGFGALMGGMKAKQALSVGVIMNARGAMEIVLASTALEFKIIDNRIFVALVVMAIVTSLASVPLLKYILKEKEYNLQLKEEYNTAEL